QVRQPQDIESRLLGSRRAERGQRAEGASRTSEGTASGARTAPPVAEKLIEEIVPEPDESLQIETTSLVDEAPGGGGSDGMLEGLETTVADFGQVRHDSPKTPSIREELNPADLDLEPVAELEPTIPEMRPSADEGIELEGADLVLEGNVVDTPPAPPPPPPKKAPILKPLGRSPAGKPAPEP